MKLPPGIDQRIRTFERQYRSCRLCPRECGADRTQGQRGFCKAGTDIIAYSYAAHHGEEPPLSGSRGSGTIFFSRCTMACAYCQNSAFSQSDNGSTYTPDELASIMLELERAGCHNINLVSPTHFLPSIVRALAGARLAGLSIPIIYNSGGYERAEIIAMLDGLIDIYLPDMRYSDDAMAMRYSQAPGYVRANRDAVDQMHRQIGDLRSVGGVASRGLIVRCLVLPGDISGTRETLGYIAGSMSPDITVSLMSQYYPAYQARELPSINTRVSRTEYTMTVGAMHDLGFTNGWVQPYPDRMDLSLAGDMLKPDIREFGSAHE